MSELTVFWGSSRQPGKAHENSGASCRELDVREAGQVNGGFLGDYLPVVPLPLGWGDGPSTPCPATVSDPHPVPRNWFHQWW